MAEPKSSTIETRFDQMFPRLTPAEAIIRSHRRMLERISTAVH